MRVANLSGRLVLVHEVGGEPRAIDVERHSDGRFSSDPQAVYDQWEAFLRWARGVAADGEPFAPTLLGAPVPGPRQVFAIGLNYHAHAVEAGYDEPTGELPVFTKFVTSIGGPFGEIELPPDGHTDWEVELVAVMARRAYRVTAADALDYVAGYTVGQDISERRLQMAATPAQFSLGKSFPGFAPMGPWLVTADAIGDPGELELRCRIDGETVQSGHTSQLIFSVPALIARLSAVLPLLPGDVIFTGTPAGVGLGRTPPRYLRPGEVLETAIDGIGTMRHTMVRARP